jgi:hypothetical protein
MKKLILILTLILMAQYTFGQTEKPVSNKSYYLNKSKNQKTIGWILIGGGASMLIATQIIARSDVDFQEGMKAIGGLGILGISSALASIPLFIASSNNARKAANISLNYEKLETPLVSGLSGNYFPTISLTIPL